MTHHYLFHPTADGHQDGIWDYSVKTWGQEQAKRYITDLHIHLQKLADKNLAWHKLPQNLTTPPDLNITVFASPYKKHMIFFRQLDETSIGIIGIYHTAMNLPVRLQDDLTTLFQV